MFQIPLNVPRLRKPRHTRKAYICWLCAGLLSATILTSGCTFPVKILDLATPTATITPSATVLPSPTPSPTPTPVPTLQPQARVVEAEKALFYGDYDSALREFITTFEVNPGPEIEAAALLGIGRVQWLTGDTPAALASFRDLITRYPDTAQTGDAQIFLAFVLTDLQRYDEAATAFGTYLERFPSVLDSYVLIWRGDALRAAGRPGEAVEAFTAALNNPRLPGDEEALRIKIAGALADSGDASTALTIYADVFARGNNEALKPTLLLLQGDLYERLGQFDSAYARYTQAAADYPRAYDSYTSLLRLLDAGVSVNERDRGLVDYFVGEYSLAVLAFDRYLADPPPEDDGAALYYKGLSLRAIDAYDLAIDAWSILIQTKSPADPYWDDAWEEIGDTEWAYYGNYEAAITTYESFAARVPDHPRAAEFLFFAAQISERNGDLEGAIRYWQRVANEYPTHYQASRAHFLSGITHYRLGQFAEALAHFKTIQAFTVSNDDLSQALLWVGKTQAALGDVPAATLSYEQAAGIDPTGYYSERARDLLRGRAPFAAPEDYNLEINWDAERKLAEDWMRTTFSLPEDVDLANPGPMAGDIRFVRGTALWQMGFYELARAEFESLRTAMESDPVNSFRLAKYTLELGLYRTAIFSARQVLNLAGLDDARTVYAPRWFNYIRFGAYYPELVLPASAENNLNPLFTWSVIRQESLYEGFVRSTAGARGLMQIIPSTGAAIQQALGWPENYTPEDLYRPFVNVRFGVNYLADQVNYFSGGEAAEPLGVYAGLAAYNGGPGNSATWLQLAQNDPDLFLEVIRFSETQRYIRGIYEIYSLYYGFYEQNP